jgi:glycosyltransferase involved in cell wall biosynthesis
MKKTSLALPKISIWSLFRDDAGDNIARYRKQVTGLDYPPELLRFYLVEGDSQDDTLSEIKAWAVEDERVTVTTHNTGLSRMRHTPHPERVAGLASTGNAALDALAADNWGDYALLIESDLIYQPDVILSLLTNLPHPDAVVSPYIWIPGDGSYLQFYDIWAFRTAAGKMFRPYQPLWYQVHMPTGPFEINSAGSMVMFPIAPIVDGVRYPLETAIMGICDQYREKGYKIYADPQTNIFHPKVLNPYPLVDNQT